MNVHLVMAASAVALLLASSAFTAMPTKSSYAASATHSRPIGSERGSTGPEGTPRGGDRFTDTTDNEELMCKVAGNPSGSSYAPPVALEKSIESMDQEGYIRCPAKHY